MPLAKVQLLSPDSREGEADPWSGGAFGPGVGETTGLGAGLNLIGGPSGKGPSAGEAAPLEEGEGEEEDPWGDDGPEMVDAPWPGAGGPMGAGRGWKGSFSGGGESFGGAFKAKGQQPRMLSRALIG